MLKTMNIWTPLAQGFQPCATAMSAQKIPVQNARDFTGKDVPSFWRDGFEMVSLDKASALQTSLIDGFDIAN